MNKLNQPEKVKPKNIKCPKCKGLECYRIPRSNFVKQVFGALPLKRYQCVKCVKKFYKIF